MPPAKASLKVTYHGPAVDAGEMDISILGPALTHLAEFLQTSKQALDGSDVPLSIRLNATTKKESFLLDLLLAVQEAPDAIPTFFELFRDIAPEWVEENWEPARHVLRMFRYIIRKVLEQQGKKLDRFPEDDEESMRPGKVSYRSGEKVVHLRVDAARVYDNPDAMEKLVKFLESVEHDGIDRVSLEEDNRQVEVKTEEVQYFRSQLDRTAEEDEHKTKETLTVVSPYFQQGKKWKLKGRKGNEASVFFAGIKDEAFMAQVVRRDIEFGYQDKIEVTLVTSTSIRVTDAGEKRHEQYDVETVHKYIKGPTQSPLPFDK